MSNSPVIQPPTVRNVGYLENFYPTNVYKFRAALARQATGGAYARIMCLGDSTTAGAISDAALANYRPNSWVAKLAALLTARGLPACMTNAFGGAAGIQNANQPPGYWDARLTSSGGFSAGVGAIVWGGWSFYNNNVAGSISFAPGVSTNTVAITYYDGSVGPSFTVDIGGAAQTVTLGGTLLFKSAVLSFPAGINTYALTTVSGAFSLVGFDAYTSTAPQIHIFNWASGGSQASAFALNNNAYAPIAAIKWMVPDLTIISLGINDWNAGTAVSTYSSSLQVIITAALLSGDVILMTPFPSASSQSALVTQALYVSAMKDLGMSNSLSIIDENFNLVSKVQMTANGLGSDVNHPNNLCHSVIANDVNRALAAML